MLLRSTQAAHLQSLGVEANQREGGAQLVRDIRHEIRFQLRQRHFLRYVAIGQPDAARQQHRKASDNQEAGLQEFLPQGFHGRAAKLDRQRQARKCPLKISVHFRLAPVPPGRGGQGLGLLFEVEHHGRGVAAIPAAVRVSYLLRQQVV